LVDKNPVPAAGHFTYEQIFMFSAIAVTAISVITSFFFWDAKDPYQMDKKKQRTGS